MRFFALIVSMWLSLEIYKDVGVPAQAAQREDAVDGIRIDPAAEKLSEVVCTTNSRPYMTL